MISMADLRYARNMTNSEYVTATAAEIRKRVFELNQLLKEASAAMIIDLDVEQIEYSTPTGRRAITQIEIVRLGAVL